MASGRRSRGPAPEIPEDRRKRLLWEMKHEIDCPHDGRHEGLPAPKGQVCYTKGFITGYIPTPDEMVPKAPDPDLSEDENKFILDITKTDPYSIGTCFGIDPKTCEYSFVDEVQVPILVAALQKYYDGDGGGNYSACSWKAKALLNHYA